MIRSSVVADKQTAALEDVRVPSRVKLAGLWSTVMFLYVYGDYFQLYQPGKLPSMLSGRTDLGATTQGTLFGMSAMLAIPALMVSLSLMLPSAFTRWINVGFGVLYSVVIIFAIQGAWRFYVFYGLIEVSLTLTITWLAWTWPKQT